MSRLALAGAALAVVALAPGAARGLVAARQLGRQQVLEAELAIVEREQGAPDYVLRPPRYRELRERERLRLAAAARPGCPRSRRE